MRRQEDKLDLWLVQGGERFRRDSRLSEALLKMARHEDTRKCILLLAAVLETPELVDRLWEVLKPKQGLDHPSRGDSAAAALGGLSSAQ